MSELKEIFPEAAKMMEGSKLYGIPILEWSKEDLAIYAIEMNRQYDKMRQSAFESDKEWMDWAKKNTKNMKYLNDSSLPDNN